MLQLTREGDTTSPPKTLMHCVYGSQFLHIQDFTHP